MDFCKGLSTYINLPLYFYGSVQRLDYFEGHSDIDLFIFTDNLDDTLSNIRLYMRDPYIKTKKVIYDIYDSYPFIYGYKIKNKKINVEMSIFDIKYKSVILAENKKKTYLPFIVVLMLYIIKVLYYKLGVISSNTFKTIKYQILNNILL